MHHAALSFMLIDPSSCPTSASCSPVVEQKPTINPRLPRGGAQGLVELLLQSGEGFSAQGFVNWLCEKHETSGGTILIKVQDGYYECDDRPPIAWAIEKAIKEAESRKGPATVSQVPSGTRRVSEGQ